ncbi:hypothetical protein [Pseudomonas sp. NPDC089734]
MQEEQGMFSPAYQPRFRLTFNGVSLQVPNTLNVSGLLMTEVLS